MRALSLVALVLAVVFPASFALGQNLVLNPDFDTDVAEWTPSYQATLGWDPLDADGDLSSGSALVTCTADSPNDSNGAYQCIAGLSGDVFYHFAADILTPSGQSETGHAHLLVQWYSEPDCTGQLGVFSTYGFPSTTADVWLTDHGVDLAPSGTQTARLRLSVWKNEAGGTLDAHFDNVVFEAWIFVDGFDSGDTSVWSSTVP